MERGLWNLHPKLRKTVVSKVVSGGGAMIEGQTPNTVELANLLPLETERQDMREQWLRRLLKNPLLQSETVMDPLARQELKSGKPQRANPVTEHGPNRSWGSDGGVDGMCADRGSVTAAGVDGRGRSGQYRVRKPVHRVGTHSPMATGRGGGDVVGRPLHPSAALFAWLHRHGWCYRLRLKGNLLADPGHGEETTTGRWRGVKERYLPQVRLFADGVLTNLGILQRGRP